MCTVLLPPGDNPIAVNKYINIFQDNRHINVVRLLVLHAGLLYPTGNISGTHFC